MKTRRPSPFLTGLATSALVLAVGASPAIAPRMAVAQGVPVIDG